jgi:carbon-monoxide dehydrogenase medium subunit
MWTNYINARSVDEALAALAQHRERARVLAGATDLLIELERGVRRGVDTLIDISRVNGLAEIQCVDGWIHIGCLVTHAQACAAQLLHQRALPLAQSCWQVGAPQIRNRATIAGNLITASPANDTIVPLMALDATVTLRSAERGDRQISLRNFYTGVRRTVMLPDELLIDIAFRAMDAGEIGVFDKLVLRQAQAISVVNVAVVVKRQLSNVTEARISLGCVAPTVVRCHDAEAFLTGKTLDDAAIAEASMLAQRAAKPIDDIRASARYRQNMVTVITARALHAVASGQTRGMLPEKPILLHTPSPAWKGLGESESRATLTTLNKTPINLTVASHKTLLRALREDAGLTGTKEGCAEGECGACTVFLDGAAVVSCLVPTPRAFGANVETVESLTHEEKLHPLQQAFVDTGAVQCGYCTPGFIMSGVKLLDERPNATQAEVQQALSGNLCRCTGYYKILEAFRKVTE